MGKVKEALTGLPCVDQSSLVVIKGEAGFDIPKGKSFDEAQLKEALSGAGFPNFTVLKKPAS